jgi:flagellar hook protein FlgE
MSLTSLYTGISGMDASGTALSVIGDNIANMNTLSFKASRVSFGDVLSQTLTSGTSNSQIGRGVLLSNVAPDFAQGSFETTGNALDMAIDGDGFFIVKDSSGTFYTRAGEFTLNKDGFLVNPAGLRVQGFQYTEAGEPTGVIDNINVSALTSSTEPTQNVTVSANIDSRTAPDFTEHIFFEAGDALDADEAAVAPPPLTYAGVTAASQYSQNITVYDENFNPRTVELHFVKTAADTWNWYSLVAAADSRSGADEVQGSGTLDFTSTLPQGSALLSFAGTSNDQSVTVDFTKMTQTAPDGDTLDYVTNARQVGFGFDIDYAAETADFSSAVTVYDSLGNARVITIYFTKISDGNWTYDAVVGANDSASGLPDSQVSGTMNFDNSGALTTSSTVNGVFNFGGGAAQNQPISLIFENFTQYASESATIFQSQDGFAAGSLTSLAISQEGVISGIFTNGQIKPVAQVALSKFTAPTHLTKFGRNLYSESFDSGQAIVGSPNKAGFGRVLSNSLELSNVDLAREFVNMISAQRGFQANSRVISTTDALLQELVNLVR